MAGNTRVSPAVELDPVIHERVRLAILSALGSHGRLGFNELKALTGATDGNLSTHSQRLEAAGYVRAAKGPLGRRTKTTYEITTGGRAALMAYLDQLEKLMGEVRGA
jgi:DNA-binding MarR family transcriptional regulator